MRQHMVTAVATVAVVVFLVGSAPGQDISATIRTYQGVSYRVADPALDIFYTIGEPKSLQANPSQVSGSQSFGSLVNITNVSGASAGGEQPGAGGGAEERLLRGHARATDITVWHQGVETRIPLDQIRAMRFARKPVTVVGLRFPPYIPDYRYSVSVGLITGEQVEADYVNLGATIVRGTGTASNKRVEIPWGEVESIIFER
jgi:hypothetical protein